MKHVFFTHDQILERPNSRYDAPDPFQIHYHFRPARPADLVVTRDPVTGGKNVSAGTLGPLTWNPYTMCLHINKKGSPHTYDNLSVGGHCVIALPGRDIVKETWITALQLPRGVNELEAAGLHECPSTLIDIPGVAECPVNFECLVEFKQDYYSHAIVFCKVLGASIHEKALSMSREEIVHWYPTYEVDDVCNEFGGSVERLGLMGDLVECPRFPLATKSCWSGTFDLWMEQLAEENYITAGAKNIINGLLPRYYGLLDNEPGSDGCRALNAFFTQLSKHIVALDWPAVEALAAKWK
jgi:flavin reductase (DIM6/NTAB) family NADH-FMN oxidoreductase RutF